MTELIITRSITQLARPVAVPNGAFVPVQVEDAPAVAVPVEALFGKYLSVAVSYETAAELLADLDHDDRSIALVYSDPDAENSVYWYKDGASGTGTWLKTNIARGQAGPTGPANNSYSTTALLKAAAVENSSAILSEEGKAGVFVIRLYADFADQVADDTDEINYIRSTADATRVWVRATIVNEAAAQIGTADGGNVEAKLGEKAESSLANVQPDTFGEFGFNVWPTAEERSAREIARRTLCPDDLKLNSQSDAYGVLKAVEKALLLGAGRIVMLPRVYDIDTMIETGGGNLIEFVGCGAGDYMRANTRLRWTGASGGTMIKDLNGVVSTTLSLRGIMLDGNNGLAARCLDMRGRQGGTLIDVNMTGAAEHNFFLDTNNRNTQALYVRRLKIDAVLQSGASALWVGNGEHDWDVCQSLWEDVQLQGNTAQVVARFGSCDTLIYRMLKIYRMNSDYTLADRNTGVAMLCCAGSGSGGVSPGGDFTRWCQSNRFLELEVRGGKIDVQGTETGPRPSIDNQFEIVNQSGGEYPNFYTGARGIVTNELGQEQVNGVWERRIDGTMSLGSLTTNEAFLEVNGVKNFATAGKMGATLPVYFMANNPAVGYNVRWDGANFVFGAGSVAKYGGVWNLDAATGRMALLTTTAAGNAGATAPLAERAAFDKDGKFYRNGQRSYSIYSIATAEVNNSAQTTSSASFSDVTGMSLSLSYPAASKLKLSFSAFAAKANAGSGDFVLNFNGSDYMVSLSRVHAEGDYSPVCGEVLIDLPSVGSNVVAKLRFKSSDANTLTLLYGTITAEVLN